MRLVKAIRVGLVQTLRVGLGQIIQLGLVCLGQTNTIRQVCLVYPIAVGRVFLVKTITERLVLSDQNHDGASRLLYLI